MAEEAPSPAPGGSDKPPEQPAVAPTPEAASAAAPAPAAPAADAPAPAAGAEVAPEIDAAALAASVDVMSNEALDQVSIDELLKQASFEDPAALSGAVAAPE